MKTSEIREEDSKGRHTTTYRQLLELPNGARIIDTPGMRELGMCDVDEGIDETFSDIADAIATFERTLLTPSRYDAFLNGDDKALTKAEKEGLQLFLDKGCAACHTGVNLGGTMQAFQVAGQYKFASLGDFKGDENGMVKTPTLRNITETAPYFHNGAIWKLTDVIKEMGSTQLGITISDKEAQKIETFLKALTGEKPQITYPQFPVATDKTPKPEL